MATLQVTIGASVTPLSANPLHCSHIVIQNNDAANDFRIGDSTVSSSVGYKVVHAGSPMVIGPLPSGRSVNLNTLYVAGTQNGLVDVFYVSA